MYNNIKKLTYFGAILLCIALFLSCSSSIKSDFNPEELQVINQTINERRITYNVNEGSDPISYPVEEKLSKNSKINDYLNINIISTSNIGSNVFETNNSVDISFLSSFVNSLREKENNAVLLFDTGDFLYGNDYSNLFLGENVANILGYMKYDALTFGHSDFNLGLKQFDRNSLVLSARSVALLSSNLRIGGKRVLPPHKIFDYSGFKIAVVALSSVFARDLTFEFNLGATSFSENIIENLKTQIDTIKEEADFIILLSANPIYDNDTFYQDITKNIDSIDLIIAKDYRSDQSNLLLQNDTKIYGCDQSFNNVYLTTLKINENKEIIENNTFCLLSSDINNPDESQIIKSLDLSSFSKDNNILVYNREKKEKAETLLSSSFATIKDNINLNEKWTYDTLLNSILYYTRSDVVLYPENDIKNFIKDRNIKLSDIYSLSSNNSDIVEVLMNLSEIKDVLNSSFENTNTENNLSLITNLRIERELLNKETEDDAVIQKVKDLFLLTKKLIDDDNVFYKVSMPYSVLKQFNLTNKPFKTGVKTNLILSNYLKEKYPLDLSFNTESQSQTDNKTDEEKSLDDIKEIQQNFNNPPIQTEITEMQTEITDAQNQNTDVQTENTDAQNQNDINTTKIDTPTPYNEDLVSPQPQSENTVPQNNE